MTLLGTITDTHHGHFDVGLTEALVSPTQKLTYAARGISEQHVQEANERNADAIIHGGDWIETSRTMGTEDARLLMEESLASFGGSRSPVHKVIGNHDTMNLAEHVVAEIFNLKRLYYSTDVKDHHLIVLHSMPGNRLTGADITIDSDQLRWLEEDLHRTDKPTLVVVHHPLSDQDLTGNIWFQNHPHCALVANREAVREIIAKERKVVAVLNGHTHWNRLDNHDGTAYITQGSAVENMGGKPAATRGWMTLKDSSFSLQVLGADTRFTTHHDIAAQTEQAYDSIAAAYAAETMKWGASEREQFDRIAQRFLPHGGCVVDMGCGPARDAEHFMSRSFRYVGVDVSDAQLQLARARLGGKVELYKGDFADVDIRPGSADLIWHSSTLQHVRRESLPDVLEHAYKLARPGAILYAHYRAFEGASSEAESIVISCEYGRPVARFISLYTEAEMNEALENAGWVVLGSHCFDHKYSGLKSKMVQFKTRVFAIKPAGPTDFRLKNSSNDLVVTH